MARNGTASEVKRAARPARARVGVVAAVLGLLLLVTGCGGGWSNIPLESIDETTASLGSDDVKLTLNDGRVFRFRVSRVEYPYLWGDRFLGVNMPLKPMRIDLREVSRIETQRS